MIGIKAALKIKSGFTPNSSVLYCLNLTLFEMTIIIIIIIIINCNSVVTGWQWLFYMYTKYEIGY